jgi:hypothetical protein
VGSAPARGGYVYLLITVEPRPPGTYAAAGGSIQTSPDRAARELSSGTQDAALPLTSQSTRGASMRTWTRNPDRSFHQKANVTSACGGFTPLIPTMLLRACCLSDEVRSLTATRTTTTST